MPGVRDASRRPRRWPAASTNGTVLAGPGDSGGPVATSPGVDAAFVVGIIIGGDPSRAVFHPFELIVPSGWRVRTCLAVC